MYGKSNFSRVTLIIIVVFGLIAAITLLRQPTSEEKILMAGEATHRSDLWSQSAQQTAIALPLQLTMSPQSSSEVAAAKVATTGTIIGAIAVVISAIIGAYAAIQAARIQSQAKSKK